MLSIPLQAFPQKPWVSRQLLLFNAPYRYAFNVHGHTCTHTHTDSGFDLLRSKVFTSESPVTAQWKISKWCMQIHFVSDQFLYKLNAVKYVAKSNTTTSMAMPLNSLSQWDFSMMKKSSKWWDRVSLGWPSSKEALNLEQRFCSTLTVPSCPLCCCFTVPHEEISLEFWIVSWAGGVCKPAGISTADLR